ncbi:MAG: phosphopantothenoylcysteine decarboxylase, partial [Gammaproteobacteria bacterium]
FEALDPVRFIGNRSSGKMGYTLAEAARDAGARVILVSGPVSLAAPAGVERVSVESAEQMHGAVMGRVADADVFIAVAAVADYRPEVVAEAKIKKSEERMELTLTRNRDILADVAALEDGPFTVGFAAETHDVEHYARDKMMRKGIDMIAANQVGEGMAFGRDDNALLILDGASREALGAAPKTLLARQLIDRVVKRLG